MILLDTSFIINLFKNEPKAVSILKSIQSERLYVSTITLAELQLGFLRINKSSRYIEEIMSLLVKKEEIIIVSVDSVVSLEYAKLQAELMKKGDQIGQFDGLIAATALVYKLSLLTSDNDFRRIKKLKLYKTK